MDMIMQKDLLTKINNLLNVPINSSPSFLKTLLELQSSNSSVLVADAKIKSRSEKPATCTYTLEERESWSQGEGGEFGGTGETTVYPTVHLRGQGRLDLNINGLSGSKGDVNSKKIINFMSYRLEGSSGLSVTKKEKTSFEETYGIGDYYKPKFIVDAYCNQSNSKGSINRVRAERVALPPPPRYCFMGVWPCVNGSQEYPEN